MEYLQPNYKNKSLPVYSSVQKKRKVLAVSHFHEGIELIRVNNGKVECYLGKEKCLCSRGDIIFVPPNKVHSVLSVSEDAEIQGVVFDLHSVIGKNSEIPVDLILNKDRVNTSFYLNGSKQNVTVNKLFCEIIDKYSDESLTYELEMKALLCKLTAFLVQLYHADFEEIKELDRLRPVIKYIKENYKETIYISELSNMLNICNDHLIRLFNEIMGITPAKYINNVRLEEAQKLLTNTSMTVTEISYAVGFSSVNYMSKVFKEVFELTPSLYRKNNR